MTESKGPDVLWTTEDVMSFLKVSKSWVYRAASDGRLPTIRFGGHLRFEPRLIRAYASGEWQPAPVIPITR